MHIHIVNGPNLNLLGKRETDIYGTSTFESYLKLLQEKHPKVQISYYQSNVEGELINSIQQNGFSATGIILNAGGYTHTSVAIADAIKAIKSPVVEVHISNILNREAYRHSSITGAKCAGIITGFGLHSYELALHYLLNFN